MSKQPEALRLAERFEDVRDWYEFDAQTWFPLAAAELRRLHALNAEALELIRALMETRDEHFISNHGDGLWGWDERARAVLSKAA